MLAETTVATSKSLLKAIWMLEVTLTGDVIAVSTVPLTAFTSVTVGPTGFNSNAINAALIAQKGGHFRYFSFS